MGSLLQKDKGFDLQKSRQSKIENLLNDKKFQKFIVDYHTIIKKHLDYFLFIMETRKTKTCDGRDRDREIVSLMKHLGS